MEKIKHFEVILRSVEKIRKELDDLQGWIHSEIFVTRKSGRKESIRGRHRSRRQSHSPPVQDLDSSNDIINDSDNMQVDVNPYIKNEIHDDDYGGVVDEDFENDQMTDYDNDNDNYQDPDYAPTASDHRRQNVPSKKSRMTKPPHTYIEKPLALPRPKPGPNFVKNFKEAKFIKSSNPKAHAFILVVDGFTYHKNNSGHRHTNWSCSERKMLCKATAITAGPIGENEMPEFVKVDSDEHYHPANHTKLKLKEAIMEAKRIVLEAPTTSTKELVDEILAKNLSPEELALAGPKYLSIKRTIDREKSKSLMK